jgi:hypothetical protein
LPLPSRMDTTPSKEMGVGEVLYPFLRWSYLLPPRAPAIL